MLVTNRLLRPQALFRVDQWAQTAAVTDYFDLEPGQLNDDRLGRALERLAAHADRIQAALVLRAVREFQLDVAQIHYDITDVELFGAYEPEVPAGQSPPASRLVQAQRGNPVRADFLAGLPQRRPELVFEHVHELS